MAVVIDLGLPEVPLLPDILILHVQDGETLSHRSRPLPSEPASTLLSRPTRRFIFLLLPYLNKLVFALDLIFYVVPELLKLI